MFNTSSFTTSTRSKCVGREDGLIFLLLLLCTYYLEAMGVLTTRQRVSNEEGGETNSTWPAGSIST